MNKDIALITWTHTEYSDIWPMYFGRLEKYLDFQKSYIFLNQESKKVPTNHTQLLNNDKDPYYKRFVECLEKVEEEYVLYMQEDHILYDQADADKLERVYQFLRESEYSNIRLIKSGELGGESIAEGIYNIPNTSQYSFSQQTAIWKKRDLIDLMLFYKPAIYRDVEMYGSIAMKAQNQKSCYYYNNSQKRGSLHWDAEIIPYIATAVCKAKWNLKQYPSLLSEAITEYEIDFTLRGVYDG